jgi:hypothetical protein
VTGELLTKTELRALDLLTELAGTLSEVVGDGPSRAGDLRELVAAVHMIQQAVLSNAGARAYPDRFRTLGGQI